MPVSFVDTNVLVYMFSDDAAKADRAEDIVRAGGTVSVQVLNELANVCRRKMRLSWSDTSACLALVRGLLPACTVTVESHETGLGLAQRYGLSIWDAMIAASALHAGCDTLWSDDMQDGMVIDDRLHVANPFRGA